MVVRDCYWHLVSGSRNKRDVQHREENCVLQLPAEPSLGNTGLHWEGPSKPCQGIWILVSRKMVVRKRNLEWLPDLGWAVGWEVVLITVVGISVWGGEGGGEDRDDELILHVSHIDEVVQEWAGMWYTAQERGWRRHGDLEVFEASGIGEVMCVDEVIHSECEFWIIQDQFLISGKFSCFLFSVFIGNTN